MNHPSAQPLPRLCFSGDPNCTGAVACAACRVYLQRVVIFEALKHARVTRAQAQPFYDGYARGCEILHYRIMTDPQLGREIQVAAFHRQAMAAQAQAMGMQPGMQPHSHMQQHPHMPQPSQQPMQPIQSVQPHGYGPQGAYPSPQQGYPQPAYPPQGQGGGYAQPMPNQQGPMYPTSPMQPAEMQPFAQPSEQEIEALRAAHAAHEQARDPNGWSSAPANAWPSPFAPGMPPPGVMMGVMFGGFPQDPPNGPRVIDGQLLESASVPEPPRAEELHGEVVEARPMEVQAVVEPLPVMSKAPSSPALVRQAVEERRAERQAGLPHPEPEPPPPSPEPVDEDEILMAAAPVSSDRPDKVDKNRVVLGNVMGPSFVPPNERPNPRDTEA